MGGEGPCLALRSWKVLSAWARTRLHPSELQTLGTASPSDTELTEL